MNQRINKNENESTLSSSPIKKCGKTNGIMQRNNAQVKEVSFK